MKISLDTKNAFKGASFIIDVSLHLKPAKRLSTIAFLQRMACLVPLPIQLHHPESWLVFPFLPIFAMIRMRELHVALKSNHSFVQFCVISCPLAYFGRFFDSSLSSFGSHLPILYLPDARRDLDHRHHNTQEYFAKLSVCVAVSVQVTDTRRLFSKHSSDCSSSSSFRPSTRLRCLIRVTLLDLTGAVSELSEWMAGFWIP